MKSEFERGPTRIRSVARAVQALVFLAAQPEERRTVKAVAEALGASVPTTYHLLNTLVEERVLIKDARRCYQLGPTAGLLAQAFNRQTAPPEPLLVQLRRLASDTGESAYLSGWRYGEVIVLASVAGSHAVRVSELQQGFQGAAHARASGKVLLAYSRGDELTAYMAHHPLVAVTDRTITDADTFAATLAHVRRAGYAIDLEEFKAGVACVAAPAFERGDLVGVYTVSAPVERFRRNQQQLIDAVRSAALAAGDGRAVA